MVQDTEETKQKQNRDNIVNQWTRLNKSIVFYRRLCTGLTILPALLSVVVLYLLYQNPVVVIERGEEQTDYYIGKKQQIAINKNDVEKFVNKFIYSYNRWDQFDVKNIISNIKPMVTNGLENKLEKILANGLSKDFSGKQVQQDVANLKVVITKKQVAASFDKVIRIEKIPLVVPTELSFQIIRGPSTQWNEIGLYINGISEHKGGINQ